jgi:hypothetical protein
MMGMGGRGAAARGAWALVAGLVGCSGPAGPRLVDGGAFVLPDAGFADAQVRDTGIDAGPFTCAPACGAGEACGCLTGAGCGCHPVGGNLDPCDPQHPETCAAPTVCSRARTHGADVYVCTDGRAGNPCSKTLETCTTALGCVCLTPPSGGTDCRCVETFDPGLGLCDRMVPETCVGGTCVRATGPGGQVYFVCSDGAAGQPCEVGDGSCQTSLGCTCPVISGRAACRCSEPGTMEGAPCDLAVPASCAAPLTCTARQVPDEGISTVCSGAGGPDAGAGQPCDPTAPVPCPPGYACVDAGGGLFRCEPS